MAKKVVPNTDWRSWAVGDDIIWHCEHHSSYSPVIEIYDYTGKVSKVFDDHVLIRVEDMTLWVDDDSIERFEKGQG